MGEGIVDRFRVGCEAIGDGSTGVGVFKQENHRCAFRQCSGIRNRFRIAGSLIGWYAWKRSWMRICSILLIRKPRWQFLHACAFNALLMVSFR